MFSALRLRSSIFRLALTFIAVFAASFLILGLFVYFQATSYLLRELQNAIEPQGASAAEIFRERGLQALVADFQARAAGNADADAIFLLVDEQCNPLYGTLSRQPEPAEIRARCSDLLAQGDWFDFELGPEESRFSSQLVLARLVRLSEDYGLLYGAAMGELDILEEILLGTLIWGFMLMLGLGVGGSWLMARNISLRLEKLNRTSRAIRRGNFARRMPVDNTHDEFDHLAVNLNEMLDHIEVLMDAVKNVSNAIAHDLRTPLTRLLTDLEELRVLLPRDAELDSYIDRSIEDAAGILQTFNALLRIAQIESGARRRDFEEMDLGHVATDVVEFYWPLAEEKGITLRSRIGRTSRFRGDQDLVSQAMSNLVDNAIKYTPAGGTVTVGLEKGEQGPRFFVSDSGPGIPPSEYDNVFDRFYRLDAHRDSEGSGLGLSVVAAVAKLHDATVRLRSNDPGLNVRMDFHASQ